MKKLDDVMIGELMELFRKGIEKRIAKHGYEAHNSVHETLGICDEESFEVRDALHKKLSPRIIRDELIDLAVASFWGAMSCEISDFEKRELLKKFRDAIIRNPIASYANTLRPLLEQLNFAIANADETGISDFVEWIRELGFGNEGAVISYAPIVDKAGKDYIENFGDNVPERHLNNMVVQLGGHHGDPLIVNDRIASLLDKCKPCGLTSSQLLWSNIHSNMWEVTTRFSKGRQVVVAHITGV